MIAPFIRHNSIEYFLSQENPKLLILSGTHGDESDVIPLVERYIETHRSTLPPFLWIPHVSPSAVAMGTRTNKQNNDINRQFKTGTHDIEAQDIMEILSLYHFSLAIDIHEDSDHTDSFYFYDSEQMEEQKLASVRKAIQQTGVQLYTGIDDEQDENLGLKAVDGLIITPYEHFPAKTGFSASWLLSQNIVDRFITPEIPGKATIEVKTRIIDAFFSFLSANGFFS
jgi:predicted deacylase